MNAKEATKQLLDMGCPYLRVVDMDGDIIVAQNKNTAEGKSAAGLKKQADRIHAFINTAPNGTYVIQGKTSPQSKPTSIVIEKGEQAPATAPVAQAAAPSRGISDHGENVLSYSAVLKLQEELANLRAENTRLTDLCSQLQVDLDDLENAEPEPAQMGDSPAMGAIAQLAGVLPAIVDKWFENQKEKQDIEKAKLMAMMQNRQNGYQQPNGQQQQHHEWE
jgi:hypothetical protein